MITRVLSVVFVLLLSIISGPLTRAAELTPLKVIYSTLSASQSPLWVTVESGIFEKNGLAVTPVFVEGGTRSMAAMLGGEAPIGVLGASSPIIARMRGADTVILAGVFNTMPYSLVVPPTIQGPKDLKGKKLAISTFGSSSELAARMAVAHLGLDPSRDVAIVQVGTASTRVSAIANGAVHGTVVEFDNIPVIKKLGYRVMVDLSTLGIDYQHVVVCSSQSFVKSQPTIIRSFMKAWAEGLQFYKTNKEASKRAIARYSKIRDPDGLDFLWESYSKIFPKIPYPTLKGIAAVEGALRQMNPNLKQFSPSDFVDLSWVNQLEKEGAFR